MLARRKMAVGVLAERVGITPANLAVLKNGRAYVQTGAGVVADSTPEGEHQECVNKAMGMMAAIGRARAIAPLNP